MVRLIDKGYYCMADLGLKLPQPVSLIPDQGEGSIIAKAQEHAIHIKIIGRPFYLDKSYIDEQASISRSIEQLYDYQNRPWSSGYGDHTAEGPWRR